MSSSVESIRSAFEHQTILPYTGEPDYDAIKSVHDKLNANVASIPSTLGGGQNGLLGLIMSDATYLLVSTTTFVKILAYSLIFQQMQQYTSDTS